MSISLALKNQIGFVNEELILYRRHSAQQVGFGGGGEAVSFKQRFSRPRAEKLLPIQEGIASFGVYLGFAQTTLSRSTCKSICQTGITSRFCQI
jgi:hypothetical protein